MNTNYNNKTCAPARVILTSIITTVLILIVFSACVYYFKDSLHSFLFANLSTPSIQQSENALVRNHNSDESTIIDVVEQSNPAVVSIVITKDMPIIERYYEEYSPFDGFFPFEGGPSFQVPRYRENGTEELEIGGGSGFFVSTDGLIVTNKHVVSDPDASYTVLLNNEETYDAQVLARDPHLDIAILKADVDEVPFLEFGDSDTLKLGQSVIAIGNALGEFRNSISVGVISGLSRSIVAGDRFGASEVLEEVLQTDAAINEGNSGGPLLDTNGKVIGVNVAVARGVENIGFALPSNLVAKTVESVKAHGEIIRPYIGIRYIPVTERLREINNLTVTYGALVVRGQLPEELAVIPGSPADKAGIQENDIILEIDGEKIDEQTSLGLLIRKYTVGETVTLKVLHKGEEKTVTVTLEKAPEIQT